MRVHDLAYAIWSILIVLIAYIIPYSLLRTIRDLSLFAFWASIAALHTVVTVIYLEKYKR